MFPKTRKNKKDNKTSGAKAPTRKFHDKSYRLTNNRSGEATIIKTGRKGTLTVFDEGVQMRRAIRHCPNQLSIFIDEQDEFAVVTPIIFMHGQLHVTAKHPLTQMFLDSHPSNTVNGGGWFEPVNDEQDAADDIMYDELRTEAKMEILAMSRDEKEGIHKLTAEVAVISGDIENASKMLTQELKRFLYNEVENNISYFLDEGKNLTIFNDDFNMRKYVVLRAVRDQIIKSSPNGKSMLWSDSGDIITTAPASIKLIEFFAEFLSTEEGMLVYQRIQSKS